jgi:hypothetical protein
VCGIVEKVWSFFFLQLHRNKLVIEVGCHPVILPLVLTKSFVEVPVNGAYLVQCFKLLVQLLDLDLCVCPI